MLGPFDITEDLLPADSANRPNINLHPVGIVIHETADPGATAKNEDDFEHTHETHTSAHYFVDDKQIIRNIPENEMAYHAGPSANQRFIGIELCHFDDAATFATIWDKGVWLAADICHRLQLDPAKTIHSHAWVSEEWHEVNHTDPVGYFEAHKKTMDGFVADVVAQLELIHEYETPTGQVVPPKPKVTLPTGWMAQGSNNEYVIELQHALNLAGASPQLDEDGVYGKLTTAAVKAFQKQHGCTVDGQYGPQTRGQLEAVLNA